MADDKFSAVQYLLSKGINPEAVATLTIAGVTLDEQQSKQEKDRRIATEDYHAVRKMILETDYSTFIPDAKDQIDARNKELDAAKAAYEATIKRLEVRSTSIQSLVSKIGDSIR
jgi:hypothetical protein